VTVDDADTPTSNLIAYQPRLNNLILLPFGKADNDQTFEIFIYRWFEVIVSGVSTWVPSFCLEFTCTMANSVGVAGGALTATHRPVDVFTNIVGTTSYKIIDGLYNNMGLVSVDIDGAPIVTIEFNLGTGSDANCLVGEV
jgi:hypothetical protein